MPRPEHLQAVDEAVLGSPDVRRRLAALPGLPINFDRAEIRRDPLPPGWAVTNVHQSLPAESPGPPMPDGSFAVAQRLMRGYHFADPSIVRAYYDPSVPLARRNMLLKLQALRLLHLWAPVRVVDVFERGDRDEHGRPIHVWGWSYCTLEGHVERGQMDWEVWKWVDSGAVEFRVHSVSATAQIDNPVIRIGFHLIKGRERGAFLESTQRRMRTFVEIGINQTDGRGDRIRAAAAYLTARHAAADDAPHDELARLVEARGDG